MMKCPLFLRIACIFLLCMYSLHAQTGTTGAINGTIQDQTGAVVPGATVVLKSVGTGATQTVKSSASGAYRFELIPPRRLRTAGESGRIRQA